MKRHKQLGVLLGLVVVAGLGVVGISAGPPVKDVPGGYLNLKVLPRDISSRELQGIMTDDFEDGLGVSCGFCHATNKGGRGLDFASDAKPEKGIARVMMRMTLRVNKRFFKVRHPLLGSSALTVTCVTCHKGQAFPEGGEEGK
jgi:hypothetical protein